MKQKKLLSLMLILTIVLTALCIVPVGVSAADTGELTDSRYPGFRYTVESNKATVTSYFGTATSVVVPASLGGYPVTEIGANAFGACDSILHLELPDGLTTIGDHAFDGCMSLDILVIPPSVTSIGRIGTVLTGESPDEPGMEPVWNEVKLTLVGCVGSEAEDAAQRDALTFVQLRYPKLEEHTADDNVIVSIPSGMDYVAVPTTPYEKNGEGFTDTTGLPENLYVDYGYEIIPLRRGNYAGITSSVNVKIACDEPEALVYHLDFNNKLTELHAKYSGGYLSFTTSQLGKFWVVKQCFYDKDPVLHGEITTFLNENDQASLRLTGYGTDSTITRYGNLNNYAYKTIDKNGTYTLTVSKKNHVTRRYTVRINGDTELDVKLCPRGDVTGDGKVTTFDFGMANAHARGQSTLTGYPFDCADVTGDGKVTTLDAGKINAHARGQAKLW